MNNSLAFIAGTVMLIGGAAWKLRSYFRFYKTVNDQRRKVQRDSSRKDCIVGPNLRAVSEALMMHPKARISMPVRNTEDAELVLQSPAPRTVYVTQYSKLNLELRNFVNELALQGSEVVLLTND